MANLKKNLVYNFLLSCSQVLLPLISIPYISRILDPEGIGRVSFIDSLSYCFVTIAEFGIVVYGIREITQVKHDKEKLRKLVSELIVLHCLTSGISLLAYGITVFILWNKIHDVRLLFFSLSFLLVNCFSCEWYFWGLEKFRYIAIRSFISRLLGLIALFIFVKAPADYYLYYGIITTAAIINLLTNIINVFRELQITLKNIQWKRHLKHTFTTYFISIVYTIMVWLDNVLLGIVSTAAIVGIYAMSMKMIRVAVTLFTDMFLVLYPRTTTLLHQEKEKELQQTILHSVQLIFIITIPASVGIFLLAGPLVQTILSGNFSRVTVNISILAMLPLIKAYSMFLNKQILVAHGKEKLQLYGLIIGSSVYVLLMLGLSYYLHDRGACCAMLLGETIVLVLGYWYVKKYFPAMQIFDRVTFLQSIAASLLFIPVIWLLKMYLTSPIIIILIAVIICVPGYFILQLLVMKNKLVNHLYTTAINALRKNTH
ncbi:MULTISPECIES: flippase [Niastella]|uniref:Flippase n=1 Tax=Niastella soli TaxID=2821487 RepID=A0ABS3YUR0_9BACT|nr:flippase [Niastella soli]MBO9201674.1 flippase [Niastella soli]